MPSSQHWLLVIPACQAGRFSLQPLAVGCRSDFPKLEHGLTKAKGGLSGREGGQSVSLSPLEAVAQILAQVTKESESDALLPPRAAKLADVLHATLGHTHPTSLHRMSMLGLHFPGTWPD